MDITRCLDHIKAWKKKKKTSSTDDFWERQIKKSHNRRRIQEAKLEINIRTAETMGDYVKRLEKRGRKS
jgi:hypothetical protein